MILIMEEAELQTRVSKEHLDFHVKKMCESTNLMDLYERFFQAQADLYGIMYGMQEKIKG